MKKIAIFILTFIVFLSFSSFSQNRISGRVLDGSSDNPLIGATILVKGTSNGVVSDANGRFTLTLGENTVIIASYLGYSAQEISVGNRQSLEIRLFPTNTPSEEEQRGTKVKEYFPMRSAIGFEISRVIDPSPEGMDRFEYGINYLFTTWDESSRNVDVVSEDSGFLEDFRVYQIGPTFSFKRIPNPDLQRNQEWQMRVGAIYNRFSFETIGLGFTARLNALTALNDNRQIADDLELEAALGVTLFGVFNVYYSRLIPLEEFSRLNLPDNTITVSINLNASAFKYGLQGI